MADDLNEPLAAHCDEARDLLVRVHRLLEQTRPAGQLTAEVGAFLAKKPAALATRVEELEQALAPFVDIRAMDAPARLISRSVADLETMTVAVTKGQMKAAYAAIHPVRTGCGSAFVAPRIEGNR
jgi:ATP/maltotriose-dependent transcriptional regulator MalT